MRKELRLELRNVGVCWACVSICVCVCECVCECVCARARVGKGRLGRILGGQVSSLGAPNCLCNTEALVRRFLQDELARARLLVAIRLRMRRDRRNGGSPVPKSHA